MLTGIAIGIGWIFRSNMDQTNWKHVINFLIIYCCVVMAAFHEGLIVAETLAGSVSLSKKVVLILSSDGLS